MYIIRLLLPQYIPPLAHEIPQPRFPVPRSIHDIFRQLVGAVLRRVEAVCLGIIPIHESELGREAHFFAFVFLVSYSFRDRFEIFSRLYGILV